MKITKLVFLNCLVFVAILLFPPTLFAVYKYAKLNILPYLFRQGDQGLVSEEEISPLYESESEQKLSVQIMNAPLPKKDFRSFIGWRAQDFSSQYVNTSGPYKTRRSLGSSTFRSTWFFGGSTMWGMGVADHETIPSHFHRITSKNVHNFGEMAWVSRQSLNQFITLIGDQGVPSSVVFYDGVNDVIHGCRLEHQYVPSHSRENQIDRIIKRPIRTTFLSKTAPFVSFVSAPYIALAGKLGVEHKRTLGHGYQNCSSDAAKALQVAQQLVNNWYTAFLLAKDLGADFTAVLQPVAFIGSPNVDYLIDGNNNHYLASEFEAVYPLVVSLMAESCSKSNEFCSSFVDASSWLDGESVYFDFCHLTSRGNERIASKLSRLNKFNFNDF